MNESQDIPEVELGLEIEPDLKPVPTPERVERPAVPLDQDGRRHHARCFLREPIRFGGVEETPNFFGVLTNLSKTGVYIETPHTLPLLTVVMVDFNGGRMWGEVCRVDWVAPQNRATMSCGFALRSCENAVACDQITHGGEWHEGATIH